MIAKGIEIDGLLYDLPSGASALVDGNNLIIKNGNTINTDVHLTNFEYSEEERVVGCWTDGKPIYEKTIVRDVTLNTNFNDIQHGIDNIDKYIKIDGHFSNTNNENYIQLTHLNTFGGINYSLGFWSDNKTSIRVSSGNNMAGSYILYLILQYTKTTDLPNSFKPSMLNIKSIIPQHNYSTEEKIVGTWVDGKPIYEKTFVNFRLVNNTGKSTYSYNLNIPDGDKSIKLEFLDQCIIGQSRPFAGGDYEIGAWINYIDNQIYLTFETGIDRSNMTVSFVLQYTKTTD